MLGLVVKGLDFLGGPEAQATITLPDSKNGDPRIVTMIRKVRELLVACCSGKAPGDRVLTRDGEPIVDYRDAWVRVLKAAGIERHLRVHNLRRTTIRGMRDRGVDRHVAMNITGHRTENAYNRYNILDMGDIADTTSKLDAEQNSHTLAIPQQSAQSDGQPLKVEVEISQHHGRWAQQDSNLRPTDYESAALTN
jgi:integrase-like protein